MVQLLHPYTTAGKTIALTIQNFVGRVMSLLFNTLSSFVTAFLPRSKHLLFSWQQSLLQHSAFFMVQLSHPYLTTGKAIVLTIWTFVSKVMSLLFKNS